MPHEWWVLQAGVPVHLHLPWHHLPPGDAKTFMACQPTFPPQKAIVYWGVISRYCPLIRPILPIFLGCIWEGLVEGPSAFFQFHGKYREMFWHPNKPLENRTRQRKWPGFAGYCTIMAKHSCMYAGNEPSSRYQKMPVIANE